MLAAVSLIGMALPVSITGRLVNLVQVLVPLEEGAARLADASSGLLTVNDAPVPHETHQQTTDELERWRRRAVVLAGRVQALKQENAALARLHERGLPTDGRLIPANIVAQDWLSWRASGLVDAGSLRGVRPEAPVTTRVFGVNRGSDDGLRDGMVVLAGETLVGWVEQVGTHASRVRWLSDPSTRMPVTVCRLENEALVSADIEFWLVGRGRDGLEIIEVDHRYVTGDDALVREGDTVLTLPDDPRLPMSLVIGTVGVMRPNPDNSLLYTVTVDQAQKRSLRHAYVLDFDG